LTEVTNFNIILIPLIRNRSPDFTLGREQFMNNIKQRTNSSEKLLRLVEDLDKLHREVESDLADANRLVIELNELALRLQVEPMPLRSLPS
jgi:hypothetical protein